MTMRLRPAVVADEPFLRTMLYEALFVPAGADPVPTSVLDEPAIAGYVTGFGRPGDVGVIAELTGAGPVGAVWVRCFRADAPGYGFVDADTPELSIAVAAGHRGGGIGSALLDRLLASVPRCSLSVDERNPAIALYRRLGFAEIDRDGRSVTMLRSG